MDGESVLQSMSSSSLPLEKVVQMRHKLLEMRRQLKNPRTLSEIDHRLNMLLPVSALPPELLLKVFIQNTELEPPPDSSSFHTNLPDQTALVARRTRVASQVCRYWRDVVFQSRELWGLSIDFHHPQSDYIHLLLQRSRPAPFDFRLCVLSDVRTMPVWTAAAPHFGMVRDFEAQLGCRKTRTLLFEYLQTPMPHLARFSLRLAKRPYYEPPRKLPFALFDAHAPALCEFSLANCGFDPEIAPALFANLTALAVEDVSRKVAPTVTQWLYVLNSTRVLERLSIVRAIAAEQDADALFSTTFLPVTLARLEHLTLDSYACDCIRLLQFLTFDPRCALHLTSRRTVPGRDFQRLQHLVRRRALVWHTEGGVIAVCLRQDKFSFQYPLPAPSSLSSTTALPKLSVTYMLQNPNDMPRLEPALCQLFSELPAVAEISTLRLDASGDFRPAFDTLLHLFPDVRTLELVNRAFHHFVADDRAFRITGLDVCPALCTLRISAAVLALSADWVLSFLKFRKQIGRPVHRLELRDCLVGAEMMEVLQQQEDLEVVL